MRNPFFTPFIDVIQPYERAEKRYTLTDYGKKAVSLIRHFRDYFTKFNGNSRNYSHDEPHREHGWNLKSRVHDGDMGRVKGARARKK